LHAINLYELIFYENYYTAQINLQINYL